MITDAVPEVLSGIGFLRSRTDALLIHEGYNHWAQKYFGWIGHIRFTQLSLLPIRNLIHSPDIRVKDGYPFRGVADVEPRRVQYEEKPLDPVDLYALALKGMILYKTDESKKSIKNFIEFCAAEHRKVRELVIGFVPGMLYDGRGLHDRIIFGVSEVEGNISDRTLVLEIAALAPFHTLELRYGLSRQDVSGILLRSIARRISFIGVIYHFNITQSSDMSLGSISLEVVPSMPGVEPVKTVMSACRKAIEGIALDPTLLMIDPPMESRLPGNFAIYIYNQWMNDKEVAKHIAAILGGQCMIVAKCTPDSGFAVHLVDWMRAPRRIGSVFFDWRDFETANPGQTLDYAHLSWEGKNISTHGDPDKTYGIGNMMELIIFAAAAKLTYTSKGRRADSVSGAISIINLTSGRDWKNYIADSILNPFGMKSTTIESQSSGMSTANDMHRFCIGLLTKYPRKAWKYMTIGKKSNTGFRLGYGIAMIGSKIFFRVGRGPSCTSAIAFSKTKGVVLLSAVGGAMIP